MAYDRIIKNGTIADGSGMPAYRGDVAVKDEKIVQIGGVTGEAKRVLNAEGLVVAPGVIDNHCHYDAQAIWGPICYDWAPGSLFLSGAGPGYWYHQHYNLSDGPATYLVIGVTKSRRYAASRWDAEVPTDFDGGAIDVKLGGKQTEYPDEDPEVHRVFEEELRKRGRPCRMKALVPWCTGEVGPSEDGEWGDEH